MDGTNKVYDECGSLLLFSKATDEDIDLLIRLIARGRYSFIALLRELVADDVSLVELLDAMSGIKTVFPERRKIYKTLEKIFIYNFCAKRKFTEASYKIMSKQYKKRVPQVKAIVATMQKFIDSNEEIDVLDIMESEVLAEMDEPLEEEYFMKRQGYVKNSNKYIEWLENNMNGYDLFYFEESNADPDKVVCYFKSDNKKFCDFYKSIIDGIISSENNPNTTNTD